MLTLLATGGTIACTPGKNGLEPTLGAADLLRMLGPAAPESVRARDVFTLDSSNVQPEEWRALARAAHEALKTCDGVVITHGTDTMAYTAAALSFMLAGERKPVILTGSQLPMNHPLTDARLNLLRAFAAAQAGVPGVYVCFGDRLISGVRCVKTHTTSMDAFSSVNAPQAGHFDVEGVHFSHSQRYTPPPGAEDLPLRDGIDPRVFLLKLVPGTSPDVLRFVREADYRGLVIEAFGLGGLHYIRRNLVRALDALAKSGVRVLVVSQCLYEKADLGIYEVASGLAPSRVRGGADMTTEAAVCKLMSNLDLIYAAARMRVKATCVTTIGEPGTLSARLQPNHPVDDVEGITASVLEGLSFGIGDAVIGLNPVDASTASVQAILTRFDELKRRYEIPTQICVLAHVTTQMEAVRNGAPCDLMFQSIAGSEKGNAAFGISAELIAEAKDLMAREGTSHGPNQLYFETGQGSELSSDAHNGWDQLTMESRCYGFARHYAPFLVNTVVGFIGPEYLYDSRQFIRAGLEDHFMGKLHGLPMGCDCCYTNHMRADQNDNENLAVLLASAGCNYFMGVPHADDVMLNYQSTGYHDVAAVRETLGLAPIAPFARWLERWGFWQDGRLGPNAGDASVLL